LIWLLALPSLVLVAAADDAAESERLVVVIPREETNAVLHNPDMGWVLYENYPLDQEANGSSTMVTLPDESFPDTDAVALMFTWQDVEAREANYDFSKVDKAYDFWRQRGKQIQLRLSSESLIWWGQRNPPAGAGVPEYVLERLKPAEQQTRKMEGIPYRVVDARNPFYRERLSAFLRAVNSHFGESRHVTLVDLRGFGAWGEWHSGFQYPSPQARRAALAGVLDDWSEAFPRQHLALSYSYDPDGPKALYAGPNDRLAPDCTTNYPEYLAFSALDYALTRTNLTFRRDGCGGAVHSNERRLNEQAFREYRRAPMMSEFLGGYHGVKQGGSNWVAWMVKDALSLHPNYVSLLGWQGADARDFIRERPDLIALGLRTMGYRLVPARVCYPRTLTNGVSFSARFDWVNRGVGRALRDYELQLFLLDPDGRVAAQSARQAVETSQWLKDEPHTLTHVATFPNLAPGQYQMALRLQDPATGKPIALPLTAAATTGLIYGIGPVTVLR
jgi:hypothetical protein